jgi:hypothetical protein
MLSNQYLSNIYSHSAYIIYILRCLVVEIQVTVKWGNMLLSSAVTIHSALLDVLKTHSKSQL